jgi:hypothetical protein
VTGDTGLTRFSPCVHRCSRTPRLWVPNEPSIRGDLGIFVDQSGEPVVAEARPGGDAAMIAGRGGRVVVSAGAP